MTGWQRHFQSLVRQVAKRYECSHTASFSTFRQAKASLVPGDVPSLTSLRNSLCPTFSRSLFLHTQKSGFTSSRSLLAVEGTPVSSPLLPALPSSTGTGSTETQRPITKPDKVQAVLKGIKQEHLIYGSMVARDIFANWIVAFLNKVIIVEPSHLAIGGNPDTVEQSPKKVNLVAALVRGMRVEDALLQLQVTVKRAAKTVYQVIHSARANATHNHGLDPDRLLVAEAFLGKGTYLKRISYHAKGKSGIRERARCRLTVVVREITAEEEAKIAKLKVHNFKKLSKKERRLVPHQLIETTPVWDRKSKSRTTESMDH